MLVSRLLRSLLRFLSPGIVPEGGGVDTSAPAVDTTPIASAPAPEPVATAPAAPAAPAAAPVDPFAGVREAIDAIGTDPATPVAGQPRDPLGRFAQVDPNAASVAAAPVAPLAPAPAAQAPAAPAQAPAAAKPGDVDLTPPEGMTPRAQERWAQLTERVKQVPELERRATEASTALDSVRKLVTDSGLASNEFTEMLDMARLYKSASPQDAQRALQMLDGLRTELATRMGIEVPGVDALAPHADLRQKVDGMLMTREDALEIARLRQGHQQAQQVTTEQRELQEYQQTVTTAAQKMEATLAARSGTPGHDAKVQYIGNHFKNQANLQAFVRTYEPKQWEAAITMMYDAYTPQPVAAPAAAPSPQPLRPSGMRPGAQVQTGPVTAQSAVEGAFASLGM